MLERDGIDTGAVEKIAAPAAFRITITGEGGHAGAVLMPDEFAAKARGFPSRRMISRAYHDSLFMARVCPTAMIFVPCRNGWSHRPDAHVSPEDLARGVAVLADVIEARLGV